MKKKVTKSNKSQSKTQQEIEEILMKTDESPTHKLFIGEEGDLESLDELKRILTGDVDDPKTKYEIYYKGIQKTLKEELPRGSKYEELRKELREEINTFLAGGKRKINGVRGADSRMGYLPTMEKAFDIIFEWRGNVGTLTELLIKFKELNKSSFEKEESAHRIKGR